MAGSASDARNRASAAHPARAASGEAPADGLQARVAANRLWYHTIELPGGVVTPGWFDLRPIVERMPWPDVGGKRCLDIGTYDGFLAFELERRGAAEVLATDIPDEAHWDWYPRLRSTGPRELADLMGPEKGRGFRIAADALGSAVQRMEVSVYDLSPERVGSFDVVVCGSLLLHLRDPFRALEAIRTVCSGRFLSAEEINVWLSLVHPRRPVTQLRPHALQWSVPNVAGHREMLELSGFVVEDASGAYSIPFGSAHPRPARTPRALGRRLLQRWRTGGVGVPTHAVLARPGV
jgi:tRNA (mo5U34)-methyltransferase